MFFAISSCPLRDSLPLVRGERSAGCCRPVLFISPFPLANCLGYMGLSGPSFSSSRPGFIKSPASSPHLSFPPDHGTIAVARLLVQPPSFVKPHSALVADLSPRARPALTLFFFRRLRIRSCPQARTLANDLLLSAWLFSSSFAPSVMPKKFSPRIHFRLALFFLSPDSVHHLLLAYTTFPNFESKVGKFSFFPATGPPLEWVPPFFHRISFFASGVFPPSNDFFYSLFSPGSMLFLPSAEQFDSSLLFTRDSW